MSTGRPTALALTEYLFPGAVSLYGMTPGQWYARGVRILARTTLEAVRDPLGNRIGEDVARIAARAPPASSTCDGDCERTEVANHIYMQRLGRLHMHQCLVAAFALACARKKRIISRLASGPRASVYEPLALPPDQAWPAPCRTHCSRTSPPASSSWTLRV
jgi:hypothetical protein